MKDFTTDAFNSLLSAFAGAGYEFQTLEAFLQAPTEKTVILRHDIDRLPLNALKMAELERNKGIAGTYFFRITPESFNVGVIKQISSMGHEIGYHYEDVSVAAERQKIKVKNQKKMDQVIKLRPKGAELEKELADIGIESFAKNLEKLRRIVPVKTICMHGSPLSKWDSRSLWKYYDYRDFGIIAEPYFDVNLDNLLYLTDTGRRWNGDSVSVRDKGYTRRRGYYDDWRVKPIPGSAMSMSSKGIELQNKNMYRSTNNILNAIGKSLLPSRIMITVHPQRWNDNGYEWFKELMLQRSKNIVKKIFIKVRDNGTKRKLLIVP